ncbi:REPEAT-CONTAINING PROTEIN putative-RELATED [Salix koriyanagi]|uniref:REPEAT-CONTAINING PROTEIN putative-RELATED n=1 Tax=Salix koriyanagi TaxID=2511006 RepID=A0A9Q1A894_9ROSI|nr:REPEAT-CONTAINING PROTEIN putative-RELATED [Salix koriyanagi]
MSFHGDFLHQYRLLQLLQSCSKLRSLNTTKPFHALTITIRPNPEQATFVYNNIITFYASLNQVSLAHRVFDNMPERNKVSYNSIISCYSKYGYLEEAWRTFCEMIDCGFRPNNFTLSGLLSCVSMDVGRGIMLQALAMKNGLFSSDAFVGTALLGLFERCGWLDEAFHVFKDMPNKSLITWNSMISLLGHHGFVEDCAVLFRKLVRKEGSLSKCSFEGVLSGLVCEEDLKFGRQIHGLIIKNGFDCEVLVVNSLINMYAKCSSLSQVEKLFEEVDGRDVVTWNTLISAISKSKNPVKALEVFLKMSEDGIMPNQTTFASVVNSCTSLLVPMCGEYVHGKIMKIAFETDVYLGSALVDYYAKCDKLDNAICCFREINQKNVVSWNSLILGYANKCSSASVSLLLEMLQLGFRPNEFSFSAALKSSLVLELKQIHGLTIRLGYENNEYVLTSLITSYGRNGLITDALIFVKASKIPLAVVPANSIAGIYNRSGQYFETLKFLSQLEEPDTESWNIVIAACARNGNYNEVFELFKHMRIAQMLPDNYTYASLLCVCSKVCNLALGSSLHGLLIKTNFSYFDIFVRNVLIDMYGKCGHLESAVKIFDSMTERNLITWTALISALGINGCAQEALERFNDMEFLGYRPDKVAFIAVLTACRHGALVREGMQLFGKMNNYHIEPEMDHYHCLVDLLARNGHLEEAEKVISCMPFPPDAHIWRSFLEGCKRPRNTEDHAVCIK